MDEAAGHPVLTFSQLDIMPVVRSTRFPGVEESISIGLPGVAVDSLDADGGVVAEPGFSVDGGVTENTFLAAIPDPLQLGDVDGDGWCDIVVVGQQGGSVQIEVLWNEDGNFAADRQAMLPLPLDTSAFALVNLDTDAGLEILVAAGSTFTVYDGANQSLSEAILNYSLISEGGDVRAIETTDFDRDGVPDLVLGHEDQMTLYRGFAADQLDD
ncbi:MAG TPA: VCBS repeat-containing protein, partial [Polyangiaceae bacterium]|nr:VCBS repeat-containing protein [Polyangiaceae bacterium]